RLLRQLDHELLDKEFSLLKVYEGKELDLQQRKALLMSIGQGQKAADDVVRTVLSEEQLLKHEQERMSVAASQKDIIFVAGETDFKTKVAACCKPVYGHMIVGYVTRGGFISIHEKNCKVLASLDKRRLNSSHVKISYAVFCLKKKIYMHADC